MLVAVSYRHVQNYEDIKYLNIEEKLFFYQIWVCGIIPQVGEVSDETVKYGREFCGTSSQE
jgi:hypothetical protein